MKRLLKKILAEISYILYRVGIKKNAIQVASIQETIDELINTEKSLLRFGDGEITMIRGKSLEFQQVNSEISEGLARLLEYPYDGMMMAIPAIFEDLSVYRKESEAFWKEHLLFGRKVYEKYCNIDKKYFNAYISRFYYAYADKSKCTEWLEGIKQIWKDKDIVVVEGEGTHNGVGNDLFDNVRTIERIVGPSREAYAKIDEIMNACRQYSKDKLFLISLGIAAKFLTEQLFLEGYRVLDIGNLDMEYEWYLRGAKTKEKIDKHDIIGMQANREAGYGEYLSQVKKRIEA